MTDQQDQGKIIAELWNRQDKMSDAINLIIEGIQESEAGQDTVNESILDAVKELGRQLAEMRSDLDDVIAKLEVYRMWAGIMAPDNPPNTE